MALEDEQRERYGELLYNVRPGYTNRSHWNDEEGRVQDRFIDAASVVASEARQDLIGEMIKGLEFELEHHHSSGRRLEIRLFDLPVMRRRLAEETQP